MNLFKERVKESIVNLIVTVLVILVSTSPFYLLIILYYINENILGYLMLTAVIGFFIYILYNIVNYILKFIKWLIIEPFKLK